MKIVIVDDNQINLTLLKHLTQKLGTEVEPLTFLDSRVGLDWCLHNQPDLIIVDYMMPAPDGLEFIQTVRQAEHCEDIPLLMITANSETEVRHQALELGANDFLTKPIDRVEFLARAKNMLALRKSNRAVADKAAWLAEEVAKATAEIIQREKDTIFRLSRATEYRDPETGAHIIRMARYSRLIAETLGMPPAYAELLQDAAPMHDIGKVGIPDHILLKPGRLDEQELTVMRTHARIGFEILDGSPSPLLQAAAVISLNHHEKWDGTGYPNGLKGAEIPLMGRIVAVADVFDALTSERPYKRAWALDEAQSFMLQQKGLHFDPECIDAFFSRWEDVLLIREHYQDH